MREDLSVFFADFAESVSGVSGTFSGILDADFVSVGGDVGVESSAYRLTARTEDVTSNDVGHGSTLTIDGTDYVVRGVQPDGKGITVLVLELA